jgi:hypothetical protein
VFDDCAVANQAFSSGCRRQLLKYTAGERMMRGHVGGRLPLKRALRNHQRTFGWHNRQSRFPVLIFVTIATDSINWDF